MRTAPFIVSLGLSLVASSASAIDFSLRSSLSQTFEANSNYQLAPISPGPTYLPVSTLYALATARTPTMRFTGAVDLAYRSYFGPGAEGLLPGLDRGFRGSAEKIDPLTTYRVEGGMRTAQANAIQLAETGIGTASGDLTTSFIEGSITRQLGYNDSLYLSARSTQTQSTQFASVDTIAIGSWTHHLTSLTDVIPSLQYETITSSNPGGSDTDTKIWRGSLGLNSRLTKRLTVSGAAGVVALKQEGNGGSGSPAMAQFIALPVNSGFAVDWFGNLFVNYNFTNNESFSLAAAKTVGPDSFATIREFDSIGAVFTHRINRYASLLLTADYSHQPTSIGPANDLYSAGATLSYQLSREWSTSASYRFRQRSSTEEASSNSIILSLTRDVVVIPRAASQEAPASIPRPITRALGWPAAWAP